MWLSILVPILVVILVITCILLTVLVLMQRPRSEGLGAAFGSGMTENIFGAQTTNVLVKGTVYLGGIFFGITLLLTILTAHLNSTQQRGILETDARKAANSPPPAAATSPAANAPAKPVSSPAASAAPATASSPLVSPSPAASAAASPAASASPKQ